MYEGTEQGKIPQILSRFMIIICYFTDCAAATVLACGKPKADLMLRLPRNPRKHILVDYRDWKILFQVYFYVFLDGFLVRVEKSYKALIAVVRVSLADWRFCDQSPQRGFVHLLGQPSRHVRRTALTGATYLSVHDCSKQRFNLIATRSRHLGIFRLPPALNKATQNLYPLLAILFPFVISFIFCYISSLQNKASSSRILAEDFLLPMASGSEIQSLDEVRKWAAKTAW